MSSSSPSPEALLSEIASLKVRLAEAEETLEAIRSGGVDALVIGDQVYTLEGAERHYHELVDHMREGAAFLNRDGTIFYANRYLADLLDKPLSELTHARWVDQVAAADQPQMLDWLTRPRPTETPLEICLNPRSGEPCPVLLSMAVLTLDDQQGLAVIVTDIRERKQALKNLQDSETRFQMVMDATQDGIWDCNLQTGECYYSPGYLRMLGFAPGQWPAHADTWVGLLHPDEREAIVARAAQLLDTKGKYEIDFRLRTHEGHYIWVTSRGQVVERDAAGKPLRAVGTHVDITERRHMLEQLEDLNRNLEVKVAERTREAEAANAAKSQFLASMSHEIRTPMNAVLGLSQLLTDEPLTKDQQQMVQNINTAGRSLLSIINDILDSSKIEAGQLALEQQPFKMANLLGHVESLMNAVAQEKGLTLALTEESPIAGQVIGDALRIEQVLLNLVGNALKFTEQGGVTVQVIPVSITKSSARLRFEIQDTGIGLSPDEVARLFQPFTQADTSIARRFGGTGLGLSISKRLVELMGGEIGVTSTYGIGSTFWFELPFDRLPDEEKPKSSATEVKGPRLEGLRLLVVDDSQINLYLAERVLKREGAEVTLMKDGQQALDALRANPQGYDLVLMDIQMPVMDGLAATRAIREELGLVTLPVIALTAGVLAEEKQNALDAGVNDFLPKPMDLGLMASMIRSYCPEAG